MDETEASYAYLLHNNEERLCDKNINYCTWDKNGNPIPFCFQYPNDKKCFYNTKPPNVLFMGCYDDPTCDGKPLGKTKINTKYPPFAYTADGKCVRSSKYCDWITDEIVVPKCVKEDVETCRDEVDDYLIGCYTEDTCGGNFKNIVSHVNVENIKMSFAKKQQKKSKTKQKKSSLLFLLLLIPFFLLFVIMFFYFIKITKYYKRYSKKNNVLNKNEHTQFMWNSYS